jgi:hypothetical protein
MMGLPNYPETQFSSFQKVRGVRRESSDSNTEILCHSKEEKRKGEI